MAVNQPKGTKNESNSQLNRHYLNPLGRCKSTQRYKERKQFTTHTLQLIVAVRAVNQPKGTKNESNSQHGGLFCGEQIAVNQPKGTKNESNSQLNFPLFISVEAVNQPKGTKNESNSQRLHPGYSFRRAVNQPKGTKNESNSQLIAFSSIIVRCCKSTQRYKERKQFTTRIPKGMS